MNTEITDVEFLEYYECLTRMRAPSRLIPDSDTLDTDVITATDFIHGAAWELLEQGEAPEEIFLRDMDGFLESLQQIVESPHIKKYNYRYLYCKKFTETMSKVYQGLLQRNVIPVPFDPPLTKEEHLHQYMDVIKKSRENVRNNYHKFESYSPILFKCNIVSQYKGKEVLIKVWLDYKGHYTAWANIISFDDECPLLCSGDSAQEAFENLLTLVVKTCSDFNNTDHSLIFDKYV